MSYTRLFSFEDRAYISILSYYSFQWIEGISWYRTRLPTSRKPNSKIHRPSYVMLISKGFTVLRALGLVRFQHRKNTTFSASTTVFEIAGYALPGLSLDDVFALIVRHISRPCCCPQVSQFLVLVVRPHGVVDCFDIYCLLAQFPTQLLPKSHHERTEGDCPILDLCYT
jgi:hypothetical protein